MLQVNGVSVPHWTHLQQGDQLSIIFPKEARGPVMVGEPIPLSIVYEDEDIIVLHKPSGVEVSPRPNHPSGSLAQGLIHYYDTKGLPYTVHIVTRLDRYTSGLMLVAKHKYSHSVLTAKLNEVERKYTALVEGRMKMKKGETGTVDAPIRRKPGSIIQREVHPEGKHGVTEYEILKRGRRYTRVECKLQTGRTHQIRVHMASIGYPLAGDSLYGGEDIPELDYQALHCHQLTLRHPWTRKWIRFSADPPAAWKKYK
ncbi:putative RNA pseudouridine synthase YjbO [Halobacillus andaensis]|uniref:Pseudouridine synthase n=1 Tax=Halobacillus andaensis TaxID=1176239 RepID=A0A917EUG9_HALAA|nr:putative RNA pseudouridine synthase YjbO [Halobacillus andaensis]